MINTSRFPALAFRNFRLFIGGQTVSLIGSWMQSMVLPYLAYKISGEPFYLGLIGFSNTLPALLFNLPAGVIIEKMDKRKVVITLQAVLMVSAFVLAALTFSGKITIWHIIVLSFINGGVSSIEIIARQAMLLDLTDRESLPSAIAINATIFNLARVIGPMLAAPFLVFVKGNGEGWAFLVNGISFLFVIASLLFVRIAPRPVNPQSVSGFSGFMEGQRFILSSRFVLTIILMVLMVSLLGFPIIQQVPAIARDVLAVPGEIESAVASRNSLMVTFQGLGALSAAITLAYFSNMRRKTRLRFAGQIVFAIGIFGLGFSRIFELSLFFIALCGWGMVTQLALTNTLIQLASPDNLRGRVLSSYLWVLQGFGPFGSLFVGWLSQTIGVPVTAMICGGVCLVGYLVFQFTQPQLRNYVG